MIRVCACCSRRQGLGRGGGRSMAFGPCTRCGGTRSAVRTAHWLAAPPTHPEGGPGGRGHSHRRLQGMHARFVSRRQRSTPSTAVGPVACRQFHNNSHMRATQPHRHVAQPDMRTAHRLTKCHRASPHITREADGPPPPPSDSAAAAPTQRQSGESRSTHHRHHRKRAAACSTVC